MNTLSVGTQAVLPYPPAEEKSKEVSVPCQFCGERTATYLRYAPSPDYDMKYDLCSDCKENHYHAFNHLVVNANVHNMAKTMVEQDNRMGQYPLYVVYEMVERSVADGQGESKRKDLEYIEDEWMCESCLKLVTDEKVEELPDFCWDCNSDCFWNCETELEPNLNAGVFFTAKACQDHIDENHYHYNKPVVYGIGAWRNQEMVDVMQHIIYEGGQKVPSFYR